MIILNPLLVIEELIQNIIIDLSGNNYEKHDNVILLNSDSLAINTENVVRLSGLTNGCRVVLI